MSLSEAEPEYTAGQLAEHLGITTRTLERWRASGSGPHFYFAGREPRYPLSWFREWREAERRGKSGKNRAA